MNEDESKKCFGFKYRWRRDVVSLLFISWMKTVKDVNEDEENDVVDLNKDDEGMSWICFLFLEG